MEIQCILGMVCNWHFSWRIKNIKLDLCLKGCSKCCDHSRRFILKACSGHVRIDGSLVAFRVLCHFEDAPWMAVVPCCMRCTWTAHDLQNSVWSPERSVPERFCARGGAHGRCSCRAYLILRSDGKEVRKERDFYVMVLRSYLFLCDRYLWKAEHSCRMGNCTVRFGHIKAFGHPAFGHLESVETMQYVSLPCGSLRTGCSATLGEGRTFLSMRRSKLQGSSSILAAIKNTYFIAGFHVNCSHPEGVPHWMGCSYTKDR